MHEGSPPTDTDAPLEIGNEYVEVLFDPKTGLMSGMTNKEEVCLCLCLCLCVCICVRVSVSV